MTQTQVSRLSPGGIGIPGIMGGKVFGRPKIGKFKRKFRPTKIPKAAASLAFATGFGARRTVVSSVEDFEDLLTPKKKRKKGRKKKSKTKKKSQRKK